MGAILVRVGDAHRRPLADQIDVQLVNARTDATVRRANDLKGSAPVKFEGLIEGQPYLVRVFPTRYRPVGQFVFAGPDAEPTEIRMHCPLHPERVRAATFPAYAQLDPELRRVLDCSTVEGLDGRGEAMYTGLTDTQKAGLLNLFTKMSGFGFDEQRTVWTFVEQVFRVRADRIFVDVQPALRDLVKGAVVSDRFCQVSGSLHTPPLGYDQAGSFKTSEDYGNLQLTFFSSIQPPLAFKVDADIDDAAGLGHVFQVLRNWLTHGATHPYDIHEILVFRQEVALPYDLA
jgi:hypothetical protein